MQMSSAALDLQYQERSQMDGYYTLDTWNKPKAAMAPPPALPGVGYKRGYTKQKKSKLRWYLVFGLSVLITAIVIVVIALVVHFTNSTQNKVQEIKDENQSAEDWDQETTSSLSSVSEIHQSHTTTTSTSGVKTTSKKTSSKASVSSTRSDLSSTTTTSIRNTEPTSQNTSIKPTGPVIENNTRDSTNLVTELHSHNISKPTLSSASAQNLSSTTPKVSLTSSHSSAANISSEKLQSSALSESAATTAMPLHKLSSPATTKQVNIDATTPEFIRDHSGTISDSNTQVTANTDGIPTSSADIVPADISDNLNSSSSITNDPVVRFESSNVTLSYKSISLLFEAINIPDWDYLQIFRYEEGKIGEVIAMVTAGQQHPILDIYDSDFRSQISFKTDALAVTLQTDSFKCNETTNFTSVLGTYTTTYVNVTTVYVIQEQPTLKVPHAIVEGRNMTMTCSVELFGSNGRLVWKFRPPGINIFFDLSSSHVTSQEWNNCTTIINSTLMFTPQSHDNGSHFRCEVVDADLVSSGQSLQEDTKFLVVPGTFCDDKRTYTVHPHPYSPCNLVVYCFQTGPLVYHINCSPGTCYDKNKTQCIPVE